MEPKNSLSILEVISKSSEYLARKGVQNHKIDAEWLVAFSLKCKRMELYLRYGEVLDHNILEKIRALVMQRGKRIPLQHILGEIPFAGLSLKSDGRALVPRCETEFLVDFLHNKLTADFSGRIADLGCGSGAILLSLCKLMPNTTGCGYDISDEALSLAKENMVKNFLCDRTDFKAFDWNSEVKLKENFDLIVCNPPYLTAQEWSIAEPEVKMHDPRDALVAKKNGFSDIGTIIRVAKNTLNSRGLLAIEFGRAQADDVENELSKYFNVEIIKDQFLVRRFAFAVKK